MNVHTNFTFILSFYIKWTVIFGNKYRSIGNVKQYDISQYEYGYITTCLFRTNVLFN